MVNGNYERIIKGTNIKSVSSWKNMPVDRLSIYEYKFNVFRLLSIVIGNYGIKNYGRMYTVHVSRRVDMTVDYHKECINTYI